MKVEKKHGSPLRWAVSYAERNAILEKWYIMADPDSGTLLPMYFATREVSMQGDAEPAVIVTVQWTAEQSASAEWQDRLWKDCLQLIKSSGLAHYSPEGNMAIHWDVVDF